VAELVRNAARHGLSGGAGSILVHIIERRRAGARRRL